MAAFAKPGTLTCLYFQSHLKEFPLLDCTSIRPRIRDPRFSQLKLTRNASNLPVIRAQNSRVPGTKFISCILVFGVSEIEMADDPMLSF